jgi:hypothetical protein
MSLQHKAGSYFVGLDFGTDQQYKIDTASRHRQRNYRLDNYRILQSLLHWKISPLRRECKYYYQRPQKYLLDKFP